MGDGVIEGTAVAVDVTVKVGEGLAVGLGVEVRVGDAVCVELRVGVAVCVLRISKEGFIAASAASGVACWRLHADTSSQQAARSNRGRRLSKRAGR